jgi:hypothetical protein
MSASTSTPATDTGRVSIVLFKPEDLYVLSPPLTFFEAARRTPLTGTWEDFGRVLSRSIPGDPKRFPDPNIAKRARGAWVPGTYRGTSGHANLAAVFVSTDMLVVDVDAGDPLAVAEVLSGYAVIIHSTYKHTPLAPRCRVVFPLASPCTSAADYNTGLKAVAAILNGKGFVAPAKDSTLGKLAFMPMHQPGIEPVFIVNQGKPLDLGRIVAAENQRQAYSKQHTQARPTTASSAYAQGALRRASDSVAHARDGERHNVLFKEAASLAREQLGLDEHAILDALLPAARHADATERPEEHERTIRDGVRKAKGAA